MKNEFRKAFTNNPESSIKEVTERCILEAIQEIEKFESRTGINLTEYEKPSASLAIQRDNGKDIELFLLGDTDTVIEYVDGKIEHVINKNQIAVQNNDGQVIKRMAQLAKEKGYNVIDAMKEQEIQEYLQINREKKNRECEGGYYITGTTLGVTEHGVYIKIPKNQIKATFLTTDGFNGELIGCKDSRETYKLLKQRGAENVLRAIRAAEENDANCNKVPRFKKSDDAAMAYSENERLQEVEKGKDTYIEERQ